MIEIEKFIKEQLAAWPLAKANYQALQGVETKTITLPDGFEMAVQYNPARIVSTGAKMDAATLKKRPCFLCEKNRPAEQEGIEWGDYTILVNPFPIFPRHLTIPLKEHKPQSMALRAADMASLAQELPDYVVFYNGQKCGASAPDHMHFQAGNRDFLPLLKQIGEVEYAVPGIGYPKNSNVKPGVIVIDANGPEHAQDLMERVIELLPMDDVVGEPMINVLCSADDEGVRMIVIPRKKHRPDFYGDGEGQMILSPASVDLGGVMITPRREDFDKIDAELIVNALTQLCYTHEEIKDLCMNLK